MTHSYVDGLLDAFVDDALDPRKRAAVEAHLAVCRRCSRHLEQARLLAGALRSPDRLRAPWGFAAAVMNAVYAQEMRGAASEESRARVATRGYRRLGYSFVVTAAVLAVTLAVPRLAYPRLVDQAGVQAGGASIVKSLMADAARSVQGALGETRGGTTR